MHCNCDRWEVFETRSKHLPQHLVGVEDSRSWEPVQRKAGSTKQNISFWVSGDYKIMIISYAETCMKCAEFKLFPQHAQLYRNLKSNKYGVTVIS